MRRWETSVVNSSENRGRQDEDVVSKAPKHNLLVFLASPVLYRK